MNLEGLTTRQIVWLQAWLAVANASNSTRHESASNWADQCLAAFDKRFPEATAKESKV